MTRILLAPANRHILPKAVAALPESHPAPLEGLEVP